MSSGTMPTYEYRPTVSGADPFIRSRSTRRARLWAGGTYFRAKDPGGAGNNISIEVIEFVSEEPGQEGIKKGKVIVTNHNTKPSENVIGPVTVNFLEQQLNWNERYVIDQLTLEPRLLKYQVNLQTGQSLQEDLGRFDFSRLFYIHNKLSVKMTPKASEITPGSTITLKSRVRVYDLVAKSVTVQTEGESITTTGWDIAALRAAINEVDPWIEMMERGTTGAGGVPSAPGADAQDEGTDADFLTPFLDTYLSGGDGLPDYPTTERTGPTRSIVFVHTGERHDGTLGPVDEIFEWAGSSAAIGEWRRY